MFEVDIETFERCNARPERRISKGKKWVDWLDFLVDIQDIYGYNWFDSLPNVD